MPGTPRGARMADIDELTHMVLKSQHDAAQEGKLTLWTIYDHPKDHPDEIVARRHEMPGGPTENKIGGDLELLRDVFRQAGLHCLPRHEGDDAKIVETWI
jgi:hypothetical protein